MLHLKRTVRNGLLIKFYMFSNTCFLNKNKFLQTFSCFYLEDVFCNVEHCFILSCELDFLKH